MYSSVRYLQIVTFQRKSFVCETENVLKLLIVFPCVHWNTSKPFGIVQTERSSLQFQDFSSIIPLSANVYSEGSLNSISLVNVSARAYSATPS